MSRNFAGITSLLAGFCLTVFHKSFAQLVRDFWGMNGKYDEFGTSVTTLAIGLAWILFGFFLLFYDIQ